MKLIKSKSAKDFMIGIDGILKFKSRVCILNDVELKRLVSEEGHKIRLSIHTSMNKMYHNLKNFF